MGKTIRRKNVKRGDAYDYKDEASQGKADAYFHSDAAYVGISRAQKSMIKREGNLKSRTESAKISLNPEDDFVSTDLARKTAVPFYLY
ncbi:hypothetical protein POP12_091 [Pectobacterium phage POP12]|nr:hypothetical protein POP12_091 [Pectobacterium phage POP12]